MLEVQLSVVALREKNKLKSRKARKRPATAKKLENNYYARYFVVSVHIRPVLQGRSLLSRLLNCSEFLAFELTKRRDRSL